MTYHMFLMVKRPKKIRSFCWVVGTRYPLLSTSTGCQTVLGKFAFFKFMKLSVTHSHYVMTDNELPMRQEIPLILPRSKAGIDSEQL